jgi:hypothetical protein
LELCGPLRCHFTDSKNTWFELEIQHLSEMPSQPSKITGKQNQAMYDLITLPNFAC